MDEERWQKAKELFNQALDLHLDERQAYVEKAAAGDQEIIDEVMSLLEVDEEDVSFLNAHPAVGEEGPDPLLGSRLGPWLLKRKLDSGGMGAVYVAERADDIFSGRVAIKVLKRGMDTDEIIRRFRREREILGHLEHRYITKLLDGGSTDDGRPYLVMEFINGEHVTHFCASRHLPLRERLTLFLKICEGVSFAHSNLIVHRDLKPGNILVTERYDPKLLDFGIAKLLDPEEGITHTQMENRMMTPAYAAPEQLAGKTITTACDIYALGVLLFEILVGEVPERDTTNARDTTNRKTLILPPSRMARRVSKESAIPSRQLKGDLDTIVLKALREDPNQRYHSVDEMAEDLERYLEGFPVRARRETVIYQLSKFLVRHRFGMTLIGLLMIILMGLIGGLYHRQISIAELRDEALMEQNKIAKERDQLATAQTFIVDFLSRSPVETLAAEELSAIDDLQTRFIIRKGLAELAGRRGHHEDAQLLIASAASESPPSLLRPEDRTWLFQKKAELALIKEKYAQAEVAAREWIKSLSGVLQQDALEIMGAKLHLVEALVGLGSLQEGARHLEHVVSMNGKHDRPDIEVQILMLKGLIAFHSGHSQNAESYFYDAQALAAGLAPGSDFTYRYRYARFLESMLRHDEALEIYLRLRADLEQINSKKNITLEGFWGYDRKALLEHVIVSCSRLQTLNKEIAPEEWLRQASAAEIIPPEPLDIAETQIMVGQNVSVSHISIATDANQAFNIARLYLLAALAGQRDIQVYRQIKWSDTRFKPHQQLHLTRLAVPLVHRLRQKGDVDAANELGTILFEIRRQILGPGHPRTAEVRPLTGQ